MKKIIFVLFMSLISQSAKAQLFQYQDINGPQQALQEYFAESDANRNKSIIYIFYNNNPCYGCPQAMSMLENLYQKYYATQYSLFMIDYQNDNEYGFVDAYNLTQPLEVVLVRINDGAAFGYQKIENLQNQISDTISFEEYVRYRIDSFLGNNG